jgi:hypothetical protein
MLRDRTLNPGKGGWFDSIPAQFCPSLLSPSSLRGLSAVFRLQLPPFQLRKAPGTKT